VTGPPTIDILCAPCLEAGRRRRLARFDLGPDGPHVHAWRTPGGGKFTPRWTDSPDGDDKVHLGCGCGHEIQIRRERILAALAAIEGVQRIPL
jgi:hypothetical protein